MLSLLVLPLYIPVLIFGANAVGTAAGVAGEVRVVRALTMGSLHSQPLTPTLAGLIRREAWRLRPDLVLLHLPNPLAAGAWLLIDDAHGLGVIGHRTESDDDMLGIVGHECLYRIILAAGKFAVLIHRLPDEIRNLIREVGLVVDKAGLEIRLVLYTAGKARIVYVDHGRHELPSAFLEGVDPLPLPLTVQLFRYP